MPLESQRRLLTLLYALGGCEDDLDFQSLLFIYRQEPDAEGAYEVVPSKRGAFSFTSYADRYKLIEQNSNARPSRRFSQLCKPPAGP